MKNRTSGRQKRIYGDRKKNGGRQKAAACFLAGIFFFFCAFLTCYAKEPKGKEGVTVVLDPGHGGENLGGEFGGYTEKDLTPVVARAMKEELEKYEGITVYLTHEKDRDMSLEERVLFAESVGADFLFCLHFNMSLNHDLFGAEVWVSAFGEQYRDGYTFAGVEMDLLQEKGLYSRGIKTRLNDRGEDYYGIIRHATEISMPAVIIEHCHLDQENDRDFFTSEEKLEEFGRLDATAAARYFGLRSEALGVDYSDYALAEIPVPTAPVKPDKTEPDVCAIEVTQVNEETGDITVELSAQDYDSAMLYYSYSYDGGVTFSGLEEWPADGEDTLRFQLNVPSGTIPEIAVRAYNGFDLYTESNHVSLPSMSYGDQAALPAGNMMTPDEIRTARTKAGKTTEEKENGADTGDRETLAGEASPSTSQTAQEDKKQTSVLYFLEVCLICALLLFILLLLARIILWSGRGVRSKKKRRRRK